MKFDFLGLKTLTVIDIANRLINERPDLKRDGRTFDLATIPMDDKLTYQLLGSGETKGVFQLESSGMQQLFKDLKADCFEDIIAAVALYRPGPLGSGMVTDFVNCKNGRQPIKKMHDKVDHLLAPTYGVVVYQEQVMQIAQALAGYSLGGADLLRRAMGKKKAEEMAKQKDTFVEGSIKNGVTKEDSETIFDLLEFFAGYGFNKSHSAAYALITYQTAYLKAHYPVELLCAIMTSDKEKIEKVVRTIADARAMGMTVLPPTSTRAIPTSRWSTPTPTVTGGSDATRRVKDKCGAQVRFGLGAVRGVGGAALETIFDARKEGGHFTDMFDLAARVDAKRFNKSVLEALVQCGAFDSMLAKQGVSRARAFASIDVALERSRAASRDRDTGQTSMFGLFDSATPAETKATLSAGDYAECTPSDRKEALVREKQSLGFYVSGHPLERYRRGASALARFEAHPVSECAGMDDWAVVRLAGMVEGYREKIFKDGGGKVAFFELEDLSGRVTVKVRGSAIETYSQVLSGSERVVVTGKVSFPRRDEDAPEEPDDGPREPTIFLNEAHLLIDAVKAQAKEMMIRIDTTRADESTLTKVADVLATSKGNCPVRLHMALAGGAEVTLALGKEFRVEVCDPLFSGLERIFGEQVAELR